jgi:shikimate kinase
MTPSSIVLLGFMGCGKTTVAGVLKEVTKEEWIDTDTLIQQREACGIDQIFAEKGEAYFRKLETNILKECLERNSTSRIYSLGGGTPMTKENEAYIRALGTVFYLKLDGNTLYERLKGDTARPLLQTPNPAEKIRELLSLREPVYHKLADYVITAKASPQKLAAEILKHVTVETRESSERSKDETTNH